MYTIKKNKVKTISLFLLTLGLLGCQNKKGNSIDHLIDINNINNYNYTIIKYGESPVLTLGGEVVSQESLKNIYEQLNSDYAHIECDEIGRIKPKGFLEIIKEKSFNNKYLIEFIVDFCPGEDANHENCIRNLEQFKTEVLSDPVCQVIFGGLTKPRVVVSQKFKLDKEKIYNSELFKP